MNDIDGYLKTIDLVFFIDLFAQIWSSFLEVTYETEYDEKSEKFVSTLDSYFDTLEERYALIE